MGWLCDCRCGRESGYPGSDITCEVILAVQKMACHIEGVVPLKQAIVGCD
jgi:hypothetical protein